MLIDAIDKNHARFSKFISGFHNFIPQLSRRYCLIYSSLKLQIPVFSSGDGFHKFVSYQYRQVEHPQPGRVFLRFHEILYVRMITTQSGHHRAPAGPCTHYSSAHRVPNIHKRERAGSVSTYSDYRRSFRSESRKVITDATTLLKSESSFFNCSKYSCHIIGNITHNKAIE